jgi:soluble lytic murein transglycosylase-like protein
MKLWLPILLLMFPRFACAQVDPAPAGQFVRQYAAHYRVSPELVGALIDVESRWNPRSDHTEVDVWDSPAVFGIVA